jgi:hypothetical protein
MNRAPDRRGNERNGLRPVAHHNRKPKQFRVAKLISSTDPRWNLPSAPHTRQVHPPPLGAAINLVDEPPRFKLPPANIPAANFPPPQSQRPQAQPGPLQYQFRSGDTHSEFHDCVPGQYDIVSRGRMPAIVFHNDTVELLYHFPDVPDIL